MGKFKNKSKSDSHIKSCKYKHKNKKFKLNHNHAHGKHLSTREVSDTLNSAMNIDSNNIPQPHHVSVKSQIKKYKLNKKHSSHFHQKHDLKHFESNGRVFPKCNVDTNSSLNIDTKIGSGSDHINRNVKKRKCKKRNKEKCFLKETNENHVSRSGGSSNTQLVSSILISDDTQSQSEDDDESIETIVGSKDGNNSKSNINFVKFSTENTNGNSITSKCKGRIKFGPIVEFNSDGDVQQVDETIEISGSESIIEIVENPPKPVTKSKKKKKKGKMNVTEIPSSSKDTEVEIVDNSEESEIFDSSEELEIVDNSEELEISTTVGDDVENCQYYVLKDVCIVILRHPTKLYFNGVLKASVIVGNVEVLGFTLTSDPQIVSSLRGSCFLCFETIENENFTLPLENLMDLGLNKNVVESLRPSDCILKFEPDSMRKICFISNYIRQKLIPFSRKNNEMEDFLKCSFDFKHAGLVFEKNDQWDLPIKKIMKMKNSKTIMCGGKSVGKSTLFRYTVNKLLSKHKAVLCLDFDIGQSEFCVPGCISVVRVTTPLLGPNYTHLQKPDRSYYVGTVNVSNNVNGYITSIQNILDYCSKNHYYKNIPWVVNTMGFVQGLGFDIIIYLIRMIQPTHLFQIKSNHRRNNFSHSLTPELISIRHKSEWLQNYYGQLTFELIPVNAMTKYKKVQRNGWEFRPREMRYMTMLSYISDIIKNENQTLLDVQPFVTSLKNVKLVSFNSTLNEALIPPAFNGSFVALCQEENTENQVQYICEGFGIIRGIDNDQIYLLTPLNLQNLKKVTHILLGSEPLPPNVYTKTKALESTIPYISSSNRMKTTVAPRRVTYNVITKYLQNKKEARQQ